ncbi:MAG: glycosyltransferase family 4 protein [Nitratireductor sp.]|uniref:glycosyltransferase family 4 protein n=1 Tax=Nitratireductor sp. TaxID=1872084 RepID=UPI00263462AB|nr:glycosyltransferase family 4 protein [Nitratireductor sp.]MCV0349059.1 glycosyltransferase family 4 protein [Nitratireductor sp.]
MKIAHLTSVHPRRDTRIFWKQCKSLAAHGHDVSLVVADGLGPEVHGDIRIHDVGASSGRVSRVLGSARQVIRRASELDCDVYHLHDPELLPFSLGLRRRGKVVYDAHEDLPDQILDKPYINSSLRKPLAATTRVTLELLCRRMNGVIAATPHIAGKLKNAGIEAVDVNNFPIIEEFRGPDGDAAQKAAISYVGSISRTRGAIEIVRAFELTGSAAVLNIAGHFPDDIRSEAAGLPGWERVNLLGFLDRCEIESLLARSLAGLVTLHPTPSYQRSLPVKMFEYMAAGIPVIASNFPLWREIMDANDCGICVDPLSPDQIAGAIDRLAGAPDEARRLGANGRKAVEELYNWKREEKKLLGLYETLNGCA